MKRILATSALTLVMALGLGSSVAMAKLFHKHKHHSAEHNAAVKKCNDDYASAKRDAQTKKGADRTSAMTAAKSAHKQCLASAPR